MPPFLGQGLNQGLRDVAALAWRLHAVVKGFAGEAMLDHYQADRQPVALAAIDASCQVGRLAEALSGGEPRSPLDSGAPGQDGNVVSRFYSRPASVPRLAGLAGGFAGQLFPQWAGTSDDELFQPADATFFLLYREAEVELSARCVELVRRLGGKALAWDGGGGQVDRRWGEVLKQGAIVVLPDRFVLGTAGGDDAHGVERLLEKVEREWWPAEAATPKQEARL
jgi:hypothetical protein